MHQYSYTINNISNDNKSLKLSTFQYYDNNNEKIIKIIIILTGIYKHNHQYEYSCQAFY